MVGNAGDYYDNLQFGNLHFTVGEMAVSRLQNGLVLSEGFHQGYYELLVSTEETRPLNWEVAVFPNPTINELHVRSGRQTDVQGALYDNQGRLLQEQSLTGEQTTFQLQQLPSGTYWLRLRDAQGAQQSFQIQKVRR